MRGIVWCVVIVVVLLTAVGPTMGGVARPPFAPKDCTPFYTTQRKPCEKLMKYCKPLGGIMKWTFKGCRGYPNVPLGDGGCQCDGYCGYTCATPCRRDKQCYWNMNAKACYVKATNQRGVPILDCLPKNSTVSPEPTSSPTVSAPSTSPTPSPVTSQPSSTPSATPTAEAQSL